MLITGCRVCSSTNLSTFMDMGLQPWCNDFVEKTEIGKEKRYPLQMCFCNNCTAVQLTYNVPKEIMYSDHLYLSGTTMSMKHHFETVALKTMSLLQKKGKVLDIGSNDGTLLSKYKDLGFKVVGVEPCERASKIAISNGIPTLVDFFNSKSAPSLMNEFGSFDIISAANVFYHMEEIHDILKSISLLLDKNGIFVVQGTYLPNLINSKAFDIIYHEHLLYYRLETLDYLLNMYDLEIFDVDEFPQIHGGSFVAYIGHKKNRTISEKVINMKNNEVADGFRKLEFYSEFSKAVEKTRSEISDFVKDVCFRHIVGAFGAPAKGTVLLNYCGLTSNEICFAVEKNKSKVGKYIPNTGIPILDENVAGEPEFYLMLSWNFKEEFFKSPQYLSGKRKFIVPIPKPEIFQCKS